MPMTHYRPIAFSLGANKSPCAPPRGRTTRLLGSQLDGVKLRKIGGLLLVVGGAYLATVK